MSLEGELDLMVSGEATTELSEKIVREDSEDDPNFEKGNTIKDTPLDSFKTGHGVEELFESMKGVARVPGLEDEPEIAGFAIPVISTACILSITIKQEYSVQRLEAALKVRHDT